MAIDGPQQIENLFVEFLFIGILCWLSFGGWGKIYENFGWFCDRLPRISLQSMKQWTVRNAKNVPAASKPIAKSDFSIHFLI